MKLKEEKLFRRKIKTFSVVVGSVWKLILVVKLKAKQIFKLLVHFPMENTGFRFFLFD